MQNSKTIPVRTKMGIFLLEVSAKGLYAVRFPAGTGSFFGERDRHPRSCFRKKARGSQSLRKKCLSQYQSIEAERKLGLSWLPSEKKRSKPGLSPLLKAFRNAKLDLTGSTSFRQKVYRTLLKVPAGKVISYGELAKRAGYPGAARAVGTAMKKNRLPIVIPCHRVIPAGGGLGEYSAGKKWKRWLLEYERRHVTRTQRHKKVL